MRNTTKLQNLKKKKEKEEKKEKKENKPQMWMTMMNSPVIHGIEENHDTRV